MPAVPPTDLQLELIRDTACGEDPQGFIRGEITASTHHLLCLDRHGPGANLDEGPYSVGVGRPASESNCKARSRTVVAIHAGHPIQLIDDDIQVPIIVQ